MDNEHPLSSVFYRLQEKTAAMMDCNWTCMACGEREAIEYHEIYARSRTMNNDAARLASFQRELCSCLCRGCHEKAYQLNPLLIQRNVGRYGRDRVVAALDRLNNTLRGERFTLEGE
jgi:hypothetical protein